MNPNRHATASECSDTGKHYKAALEDPDSVDKQVARAYVVPFSSSEVNMTNCYFQCESFFSRCQIIHFSQLISSWMMAGYLGPVGSVDEAYQKGLDILYDLIYEQRVLQISDTYGMVQFVKSTQIYCRHQGQCVQENLGLVDFFDLEKLGNILLADGMRNPQKVAVYWYNNYTDSWVFEYISHFNPVLNNSLEPLLENVQILNGLLLRGNEFVPQSAFPIEMLRNLTILEVSGSGYLTTIPENTISQLSQLRYLNLSDLLVESLPQGFFSQFFKLRLLILRGCSNLSSLPDIPSYSLEVLDLSHCTALQNIIGVSSRSLRMVDLSYTALPSIPSGCYKELTQLILRDSNLSVMYSFESVESLRVLDLSGAREVNHIDNILAMKLEVLDLSRTQFEYIDFNIPKGFESRLRCMLLRECTSLKELPTMKSLPRLEVLDISGCDKLLELPRDLSSLRNLKELNLSGTNVKNSLSFANLTSLSKLLLRDLVLDSLETITLPSNLEELDLKGVKLSSSQEFKLDFLEPLQKLQILNLSQTSVAKLPCISKLVSLRELILADCQQLEVVPDLQTLVNLEVLDLSVTNDTVSFQAETEIEPQRDISFSAPSSLRKLVLTNRSGVQKLFPLTSVGSLEFLDLRGTDVRSIPRHYMEQIKSIHLPAEIHFCEVRSREMGNLQEVIACNDNLQDGRPQGRVSKPVEVHLISTTENKSSSNTDHASSSNQPSAFDRFEEEFTKLDSLISEMQNFNSSVVTGTTTAATRTTNENGIVASSTANTNNLTSKLEMLHADIKHIHNNIDRIKSSRKHWICEELFQELMGATTHLTASDFLADSTSFMRLVRIVVKLKLLIPPEEAERVEVPEITKKKEKPWFKRSKNKEKAVDPALFSRPEWQDLCSSYESLTNIQKNCLLCFSAFPFNEDDDNNTRPLKSLVVKKRMLFYWWVGEGYIDPHHYEKNVPLTDGDLTKEQVSSTQEEKIPKTVEEIGEHISKVLIDKGFIEPVMEKDRQTGNCCMSPLVHSFVTVKAIEEVFFDFNQENDMLTPHFTRSTRACLLKPENNCPSSCKLWADLTNSATSLKSFRNVRTLLNVSDRLIDIKSEWFSKMKYLSVLLLGSWRYDDPEHVEIEDQTFLEELKNMKQLRLLSLQGLLTIMKLPDSVCQLENLKILDLRECGHLEALPTGIGSLKNLTHLDITNCRLLTSLPKGIRLLSKLEVLKGFVVTYQSSGLQHRKLCIFKDLLNLKKLRKLSIIVNDNMFPNLKELQVLKRMDNLRKLKISWEKDFNTTTEEWCLPKEQGVITKETPRLSKRKKLKCWGHQSDEDDMDDTIRSEHLDNIEKLVLMCFPFKTAPHWLNPRELKKLEKLYIVGGNLDILHGGTNQNKWNATTLRLKYLPYLHIRWRDLKNIFPKLTYLEKYQCPKLVLFPCNEEGVWIHESVEE